jgi:hypothetical protein
MGVIGALAVAAISFPARAQDAAAPAGKQQQQQAPASQPAKVQPIDFRKLKELMPAELAGIKRSNNEGQKTSLGEFQFSQASATYEKADAGEKDPHVTVEIMDYGAAPGMGQIAAAWQQLDIDKESDGGYEKTTKVKGNPAYETYTNESKSGQVQVWVGNRFYVNVNTTNLSGEELKKLVESLPLEKLAQLK